ncbi:ClpP/crotonase [Gonapodya prolifera JEL478]|uniref:ClpP/crotonase n=1 Tax=Gonapodya prolifera (strain JEL478) TaxID=1344416 RepID=A0A139A6Q3_GONPJ|nr:ClpP/crotonase [Gonapodya prolifera JEL478]|eukprot:KXS12125.1 ClpP/crotonase [Gonapodya prolifera JEL478]
MSPKFNDISVDLSHEGKVATLTFRREKTLNSMLQRSTYPEILRALRYIDSIPSVVITVITGTGRFFSSGQDLRDVTESAAKRVGMDFSESQAAQHDMLWNGPGGASLALLEHKKIVVVALNGPAVGWPAAWIPAADLIVASDSAYVYMPFVHIGAMIEASGSYSWTWRVGGGLASDMILTGRRVAAADLYSAGGVNRVWPAASFSTELAKFVGELANQCNPNTLLEAKALIRSPTVVSAMQTAVVNETYHQVRSPSSYRVNAPTSSALFEPPTKVMRRSGDSASGFAKRLAEIEAKKAGAKSGGKL